ncbi:MAG TPA: arsenic transporter [Burkholderiaceae bacterium]
MSAPDAHALTWAVAALATLGVVTRPFGWPEAVWALAGAVALVAGGLVAWPDALRAAAKGRDVYLFLAGMMLLAEMARQHGLFDHLAARAVALARGSPRRLFALVFAVGTGVTVLLSNDATAVVLTPAVLAVTRAARVRRPLPYLLACAFIANAASFVLPISNPANLVVFGAAMPPLGDWLARFTLPSLAAIGATWAALRWQQRGTLDEPVAGAVEVPHLSACGRLVAWAIGAAALALLAASASGADLGLVACTAALLALGALALQRRAVPWAVFGHVAWSVLPLVAGLFVLVEAVQRTGALQALSALLLDAARHSTPLAALAAGVLLAFGCNAVNNLPAGLFAGAVAAGAQLPVPIVDALLIGVDLGPNLSVTGSLATILWLVALRREGVQVGFGEFLRVGIVVMPAALLPALALAVL